MAPLISFGGIMQRVIQKIKQIENEEKRRKGEDKLAKYNTGEKVHLKREFLIQILHRCSSRQILYLNTYLFEEAF